MWIVLLLRLVWVRLVLVEVEQFLLNIRQIICRMLFSCLGSFFRVGIWQGIWVLWILFLVCMMCWVMVLGVVRKVWVIFLVCRLQILCRVSVICVLGVSVGWQQVKIRCSWLFFIVLFFFVGVLVCFFSCLVSSCCEVLKCVCWCRLLMVLKCLVEISQVCGLCGILLCGYCLMVVMKVLCKVFLVSLKLLSRWIRVVSMCCDFLWYSVSMWLCNGLLCFFNGWFVCGSRCFLVFCCSGCGDVVSL